ncbi:MAG: zinc ribbon domain-containing protein [Methanobrevibacter sp.]|uniref:zinc ribbon domain-containing protein n=1 Tax=Methanobrevibacter sp. TaxID=66852 RepID=UPI002E7694E1|nr:zinc ribbon domain-containing protein [Methanobrevibacter sp.]MEE0935062.1 zinc ribbon domain-containing protein [Methanobrevibacter sp.]
MIECTNCGKELRDNFRYCRICGTELDGGEPGDYSTDMLNVFRHGDEYLYLFSEKGNQVILKADTLEELAVMVADKKYPWQFRQEQKNADSQIMETGEIQEYEVENVWE